MIVAVLQEDGHDGDYVAELVYRLRKVACGVLLVRLPGLASPSKADAALESVREHGAETAGAFTVVSPGLVRIPDCPCRRLGQAWLGIAGALLRTCGALMVAARPPPSEAGRPLRQWSCAAARGAPIDHTAVQRADIDTSAPDSLPHACTQSPPATNSLALAVDPVLRAAGRPHDPPRTALEHCGTPRSCVHIGTDRHRTHRPTSPSCTAYALECTMAARAYSWGGERGTHHQEH